VGHTPPNFSAKPRNGQPFELSKVVAKNKYTILMFWSSWCTHCKDAAPEILAFDKKYSPNKIQLVGYSIDEAQQLWEKALDERQFTFPNILGGKGWNSPVAKQDACIFCFGLKRGIAIESQVYSGGRKIYSTTTLRLFLSLSCKE
jgi:thiol-disulfide isomerase/thioredoxin